MKAVFYDKYCCCTRELKWVENGRMYYEDIILITLNQA